MNSTGDVNGNGVGLFEMEVYPTYSTNSPTNSYTNGPITIVNNSFGFQSVTLGSFLVGDPSYWSSSLSGAVDALISPGTDGSGEPWPTIPVPGLNGTNFCQIYTTAAGGGGLVYQNTGILYVPGAIYTLTTSFGLQTNQTFAAGSTMGFYNSVGTAISTKTISNTNLAAGKFTSIAMTYTGTGNEGGNSNIVIGFNVPPPASSGSYLDFNNVQLVVTYPVAPSLTNQPVSITTNAGSPVTLSVLAGGMALTYQWYFNSTNAVFQGTNPTLTLTNVQNSGSYDVVVTNAYGAITSSIASLTVIPSAPTNLSATPQTNAITLSCASVANAAFYSLYRSRNSGGPYAKIANTSSPNYTDFGVVAGTTYYYVMSACNGYALSPYSTQSSASPLGGNGGGSLIAPQASAAPSVSSSNSVTPQITATSSSGSSGPNGSGVKSKLLGTALKPPTSLKATGGVGLVKLTFGVSAHATSYIIYRSSGSGGSYTQAGETTSLKYSDMGAAPHTKYYYVVRASDGINFSDYSEQVSATSR